MLSKTWGDDVDKNGIMLEETMVAALETVDGLSDRVCPVVDIKKSTGPLVVYDQKIETEEEQLYGDSGLLTAVFQIHVLHNTYTRMRHLSERVKATLKAMKECSQGQLHVEGVTVELATPDLLETKVQLFRRTYNVTFLYQIKED